MNTTASHLRDVKRVRTEASPPLVIPQGSFDGDLNGKKFSSQSKLTRKLNGKSNQNKYIKDFIRDENDWPVDWPSREVSSAIDLQQQDLWHESSSLEWWYFKATLRSQTNEEYGFFVSFFVTRFKDSELLHSHAWSLIDPSNKTYRFNTGVDQRTPEILLNEDIDLSEEYFFLGKELKKVLQRGNVLLPDRLYQQQKPFRTDKLSIQNDGCSLYKQEDGTYKVVVANEQCNISANLVFTPKKKPMRANFDGLTPNMFYYTIPDMAVSGSLTLSADATATPVAGQGWYDHQFGPTLLGMTNQHSWTWFGLQLSTEEGEDIQILASELCQGVTAKLASAGDKSTDAVLYTEGGRQSFACQIKSSELWTSTRTFETYPLSYQLDVPENNLYLNIRTMMKDQECVSPLLGRSSGFYEGMVHVEGTYNGKKISGDGFVERTGYKVCTDIPSFFKSVGRVVHKEVQRVLPSEPTYNDMITLVASEQQKHWLEAIDFDILKENLFGPVRTYVDRGGKSWRSWALLSAIEVVGGDSREFADWVLLPELIHVGSLIIDDVQDDSDTRRGGPCTHLMYGTPLAINSGCAAYFWISSFLKTNETRISKDAQLAIYDIYFETMRAAHAGQCLDISGFDAAMDKAVVSGDGKSIEERIVAIHRLKSAAPASGLARMGAIVGKGNPAQVQNIGLYFESLGVAFQIIDDVLNLRGFKGNLKDIGEDLRQGKVTMPVAKGIQKLNQQDRLWLWNQIKSKPQDQNVVNQCIKLLEDCGAIEDCVDQADRIVQEAWNKFDEVVPDSMYKCILRLFGSFILRRHY